MHEVTKRSIEWFLVRCGFAKTARNLRRRRALILAYHNIVPSGECVAGDASLHLPQREFARHLDMVLKTHDPIPLAEVMQPSSGRRPRVAFTFDDAYKGAVSAGVEELVRRGLPATIFVAPAFVGGGSFWWDALASPSGASLSGSDRLRALTDFGGRDDAIRRWALEAGYRDRPLPEHAFVASEQELQAALKGSGISLGAHSWSHPNLTTLDRAELRAELVRPREWLHRRFGAVAAWIAYPYGLFSDLVEQIALQAGYRAALRIDGGLVPGHGRPPFSVPRVNVPAGVSANGFLLRMGGLLRA